MEPLITIIIPVYNVELYIRKCIDSVLNQSYRNIEIILINDGSKDKSLSIIREFNDKRIRVIDKENTGQSDCRYIGYSEANGEYIYFMDSDDTLEENAIQVFYESITKFDADICCCRFKLINSNGLTLKISEPYRQELLKDNLLILKEALISGEIKGTLWTKMFKKSFLEKSKLKPERRISLHDDCMFSFLSAVYAKRVCFTQSVLYNALQRENSISRTCKPIMVTIYRDIYNILLQKLKETNKWELVKQEFYTGYCKSVLYALILAAVRSQDYHEYRAVYYSISTSDFYFSDELKEVLQTMSWKMRILYALSKHTRMFYQLSNRFAPMFNH